MTRNLPKILGALAFVGTVAVGTAAPALADDFYVGVPGIGFGIGPRWEHRSYDRYYDYGRPYHHHYWHHHDYDWD